MNKKVTATLRQSEAKGSWTYVVAGQNAVTYFGTRGLVKVHGDHRWPPIPAARFMALGDERPEAPSQGRRPQGHRQAGQRRRDRLPPGAPQRLCPRRLMPTVRLIRPACRSAPPRNRWV